MKFNKWTLGLAVVAVLAFATAARASLGFDTYKATRTYILAPAQNIGWVSGGAPVTNGPVDLVKSVGVAAIFFDTITNTGATGGTLTATLLGSPDQTNMFPVSNFYLVTNTINDVITNAYWGGTNLLCTNIVMATSTPTTPNAAMAGYATPYPYYTPATNSGAITLNGNKTVEVGLNTDDQYRYLYVVYTTGGTVTNFTAGAAKLVLVPFVQ